MRESEHAQNDYDRLTPAIQKFVHGGQSGRGSMVNMIRCGRMIQIGRVLPIRVRAGKPTPHS